MKKLIVNIKDLQPGDCLNSGRIFSHLVPVERFHIVYESGIKSELAFLPTQEFQVTRKPKQVRAADTAAKTLAWSDGKRFAIHRVEHRPNHKVTLLGWKNGERFWWDTDADALFDLAD